MDACIHADVFLLCFYLLSLLPVSSFLSFSYLFLSCLLVLSSCLVFIYHLVEGLWSLLIYFCLLGGGDFLFLGGIWGSSRVLYVQMGGVGYGDEWLWWWWW